MADYPQIDLTEWKQVGEGGNGKTYEKLSEPEKILKVNNSRSNDLASVKQEFEVSRAVESLGLPTPRMFDIVRVGDAFGAVSERIRDKKSLSRICHDEPSRTAEMGALLARLAKDLSSTQCNTEFFPDRRQQAMKATEIATYVSRKYRDKIRAFIGSIPECTTCSHGDFQPGNVIMSGGKCYWIDLGRFAYGDPRFDIGHLFQICRVYAPMKQVQDIFHMTLDQFHEFWDAFAKEYTGKEDHSEFDAMAGRFAAIDVLMRPIFLKPSFAEKVFFRIYVTRLVKKYY